MRHRLAFLLMVVLAPNCWAQSGGLINATRGVPQPNDPSGTTLYSTAIINAAGNAATAQIGNTTVPVRIVIGGAGTTGNAVLASTGTLAPCTMDAAVTSGGNFFVIESTINPGQCHPQSLAPTTGTWVIGYLHDATTTSGNTALVHVNGFIYGGAGGGGSGTVSPNNGTPTTPLAAYAAAGGSTTVQPSTTGVSTTGGIQVTALQFGATINAAPEIGIARIGSYTVAFGSSANPNAESALYRSSNSCTSGTTDISFTATAGNMCPGYNLYSAGTGKNWILHCVIPWTFTAGTGTANVAIGIVTGAVPAVPTTYSGVLWGTAASPVYQATTVSLNGSQPIVTLTAFTIATGALYTATIDGVLALGSTASSFNVYATTSNGTGAIKAGAYCRLE